MTHLGTAFLRAWLFIAPLGSLAAAQSRFETRHRQQIVCDEVSRVADPKLVGGEARLVFHLEPVGSKASAFAEVRFNGKPVVSLWKGFVYGDARPMTLLWDGRDASGVHCPTGAYTLRLSVPGVTELEMPLDIVRLGVTEIEAQDGPAEGVDEYQMVYFRKDTAYAFYATPAIHEYVNVARAGETSDLDLDDGQARPVVAVHTGTDSPVLDGASYATTAYNYPLAYVKGASPRLEFTLGASATAPKGGSMGVGYPLADGELRLTCDQAVHASDPIVGGKAVVDLAPLPDEVGRTDLELAVRWQVRMAGESSWREIPGAQTIPLRIYTLLGPPQFKLNASGTQYSGPWVEVAEDVAAWKDTLGLPIPDQHALTEVFVHGFFGQNGGIPTAIEGVVYDAFPLGGDGGATHYYSFGQNNMNLSALLNGHARGKFVNCSDNMGAATTMLSMMGATGMRPLRLGEMNLRAIWGIGAPGYTLKLWGTSHGFSYHHIVTDDGGVTVSDTCMQLDSDGNPLALPGTPGWNVNRTWGGPGGYMDLSANNVVTKSVEFLPGLQ